MAFVLNIEGYTLYFKIGKEGEEGKEKKGSREKGRNTHKDIHENIISGVLLRSVQETKDDWLKCQVFTRIYMGPG